MSFNPKVSIVIPVYNGSNYLKEAIDSALAQTYKNIEVIVVNDGSNDNGATEKIALSYGDQIRYFSKPNGGVATALNLGIEKMTGEYFSWLSHDDKYLPAKISTLINVLVELEDKTTVLYSDYELIDESSSLITQITLNHVQLEDKPFYSILRGSVHGCSMLIHKSCFEKIGLFNIVLKTTQDYDLWFRMLQKYHFKHVNRYLIQSRWHPEQDSKKSPHTIKEANELWIHMMSSLTEEQRLACEDTNYLFYLELSKFLKDTPYQEAYDYSCKLADDEYHKIVMQRDSTLVSVVIPFIDRVHWLIEALKSVQAQTHINLEILVIDNGCEESIDELLELAKLDNRIKILKEPRKGTSFARNLGMDSSNGEYIAFLDADDLWLPDKVSKQLEYCLLNGADFCHTSYSTFDEEGVINNCDSAAQCGNLFPNLISNCRIATPTVMLSKNILDLGYRFPLEFSIGEDVLLWVTMSNKYHIFALDQYLTRVRIHDSNSAHLPFKFRTGVINIAYYLLKNMKDVGVSDHVFKLLEDVFCQSYKENIANFELQQKRMESEILLLKNQLQDLYKIENSRTYILGKRLADNFFVRFFYFNVIRPISRVLFR